MGVVTNWDSDQDEMELQERMEKKMDGRVDYKYWTVQSPDEIFIPSDTNETFERARKREGPHRRRRGFGMPTGSGATSDGVRFSVPLVREEEVTEVNVANDGFYSEEHQTQQPSSQWYITLGNSTGLLLNTSLATKPPVDKRTASRTATEAAFQVRADLLEDSDGMNDHDTKKPRRTCHEQKVRQIASLLNIPIASARTMIRRVPSFGSMDIHTLSRRCVEISLLLQCTPSKVSMLEPLCLFCFVYCTDFNRPSFSPFRFISFH